MPEQNQLYLAFGFVALSLSTLILIGWGIDKTFRKLNYPDQKRKTSWIYIAAFTTGWILLISLGALSGFLQDFLTFPPRMGLVLVLPLLFILWLTWRGKLDSFLRAVNPSWLIQVQSFRVLVELLLWLAFLGNIIPIQMTLEGRNWDILTGLTAPIAALVWLRKDPINMVGAVIWNIGGLLLLANILTIALLSMPTPMRFFMNEPANAIVGTFPFVWLPGILVTVAYSMHILSLRQLYLIRMERRFTGQESTA